MIKNITYYIFKYLCSYYYINTHLNLIIVMEFNVLFILYFLSLFILFHKNILNIILTIDLFSLNLKFLDKMIDYYIMDYY